MGLVFCARSDSTSDMIIVDFACEFSQNTDNGGTTDGRVRLSGGSVFIDMCTEGPSVQTGAAAKRMRIILRSTTTKSSNLSSRHMSMTNQESGTMLYGRMRGGKKNLRPAGR